MVSQNPALHTHIERKKKLKTFDKFIIVASFVYPLTGLPQVYAVFNGQTDGVSVIAWFGFLAFSALFFAYGFTRKITPMIVTNFLWVIVNSLVIIGTLLNSAT